MHSTHICLYFLVAVSSEATTSECHAASGGSSMCRVSDESSLIQNRIHVALEAEKQSQDLVQDISAPRPTSTSFLQYFKGWAKGQTDDILARMVPDDDIEFEDEGTTYEIDEEQDDAAQLETVTASQAVALLSSAVSQECSENSVSFIQAKISASEFKVVDYEVDDGTRVRHALLQDKDGGLQYLASHQLPNGNHKVLVADPPVCANVDAFLETEHAPVTPTAVAGDTGNKPAGEASLLHSDDPLVKDCIQLLVKTVADDCNKAVTVKFIKGTREIIDGLKIAMHVQVCTTSGCHYHRPTCAFEYSTHHKDAKLLEFANAHPPPATAGSSVPRPPLGNSSVPAANSTIPMVPPGTKTATLSLHTPLCDIDVKSGVNKTQVLDLKLMEQHAFGEISYYKGYEHVYDGYPAVAALQIAIPNEVDFRTKYPKCFPAMAGKKTGTETVRNQGTCGSCWAFAGSTTAMTNLCVSGHATKSKKAAADRYEISVQKIMSCKAKGQSASSVMGCEGGHMGQYDVEARTWGLAKERDNLYKCGGGDPKKHFKQEAGACERFPWGGECTGQANPDWWWGGIIKVNGEHAMKSFLANGQSMYISMAVYSSFMEIKGMDIYSEIKGTKNGGHAMNCLGYGKEGATRYWLIQNSWGPQGWGDQGYARVKRGIDLAGIETNACVARVWVEGGTEQKCHANPKGSGVSSTGAEPFWPCAKAAKRYCHWQSVKNNCPNECKSCTAFNGKGTKSAPTPKPQPTPAPQMKPKPKPAPKKVPPGCVDRAVTTITFRPSGKKALCKQLPGYCKYGFVRKQCCATCKA